MACAEGEIEWKATSPSTLPAFDATGEPLRELRIVFADTGDHNKFHALADLGDGDVDQLLAAAPPPAQAPLLLPPIPAFALLHPPTSTSARAVTAPAPASVSAPALAGLMRRRSAAAVAAVFVAIVAVGVALAFLRA